MPTRSRFSLTLPHVLFSILFTAIIFIINNFLILEQTTKWFLLGNELNVSGLIAFYVFGYGFFLAFFMLIAHRYMIKISAIIFIIISASATYFISKYQISVDPSMVLNLLHTDPTEAQSFLTWQMLPYVAFLILLPIVIVLKIQITFQRPLKHLFKVAILFSVALSLSIGMLYLKFDNIHRAVNISNKTILFKLVPVNAIHSVYNIVEGQLAPYFKKNKKPDVIKGSVTEKKDLVVVLVVGETSRQRNFSLYGYGRKNTNPLLSQYKDLHILNGHARVGSTLFALPEILAKDDVKLVSVTSALGINTSCYVNFSLYENCEAVGEINVSDCGHDDNCYDEDVLPLLKDNLDNYTSGQRLVVLHLGGGSHGPSYSHRYPKEFQKFNPQCLDADVVNQCTKEEIYNSFDNTILYVDSVIDRIIKTLETSKKPYVLIYLSDHGESLLENGRIFHGMPPGITLPPEQSEIPLIVKSSVPISIIDREVYNQPDVYDTVLDLLAIKTDTLNKERVFIKTK